MINVILEGLQKGPEQGGGINAVEIYTVYYMERQQERTWTLNK